MQDNILSAFVGIAIAMMMLSAFIILVALSKASWIEGVEDHLCYQSHQLAKALNDPLSDNLKCDE